MVCRPVFVGARRWTKETKHEKDAQLQNLRLGQYFG